MNTFSYNKEHMMKPITNIDDVVEIYFESGSVRLRLRERRILMSVRMKNSSNLRGDERKD